MKDFEVFSNKLSNVAFEITLYLQLYGSEEKIQIQNNFNPLVFGVFQKNMYVMICLEISKLLDPSSKSNTNLSINKLINDIDFSDNDNKEIELKLKIINDFYCESIKKFRNKVVAHNDYGIAMKKKILPTKGNIEDLKELCNKIYELYSFIRFKSGKDSIKVSRRVDCILPRELDGDSFINKLEQISA